MDDIDEVVAEFLVESHENVDQLDGDLVELERRPGDRAVLSSIFRVVHTIKGTCSLLGFDRLQALTHAGENLLSCLRDGSLSSDEGTTDALLAMIDAVRWMLLTIESTGTDGDDDHTALIAVFAALRDAARPALAHDEAAVTASSTTHRTSPEHPEPTAGRPTLGQVLVDMGVVESEQVSLALAAQGLGDKRRLGEILVEDGVVRAETLDAALARHGDRGGHSQLADANVRVDVVRLDRLMNLAAELLLVRDDILRHVGRTGDPAARAASHRLDLVARQLNDAVLTMRMQPVRTVWARFPRIVRDLAQQCGKRVRFETEGDGIELDRAIVEAVKDPLAHIVRNAVDHGIEAPAERETRGKAAEGVLRMRAYHEGSLVTIDVTDDGAGVDVDRVKALAVARGLLTAHEAAHIADGDACHLLFIPGLSTADRVTSMSGRGVGMDVVKTNIEQIGGAVEVRSERGLGTTIRVTVPLTLASLDAAGLARRAAPAARPADARPTSRPGKEDMWNRRSTS